MEKVKKHILKDPILFLRRYLRRAVRYRTLSYITQQTRRSNEKRRRRRVRMLTNAVCNFCGTSEELTIDHIIPVSKGGAKYNQNNFQVLCRRCNLAKKDKLVLSHLEQ